VKVKELLEKLSKANPDLEVCVAPIVLMESMNSEPRPVFDPFTKTPIRAVGEVTNMETDEWDTYIVLGFNPDAETDRQEPDTTSSVH
jgi:hypothetical protein